MKKSVKTQHEIVTWKMTRISLSRWHINQVFQRSFLGSPKFPKKLQMSGVDSQMIQTLSENLVVSLPNFVQYFKFSLTEDNHLYIWKESIGRSKQRVFAVYKIETCK